MLSGSLLPFTIATIAHRNWYRFHLDIDVGGAGQAECATGYPGAQDTCSRECARVIQPFWQDCGPLLMQMNMGGTEGMQEFDEKCAARPTCDFSLLFQHMQRMDEICCEARGSCAAGNPGASDQCTMGCARIFEPFWDDCGAMILATMGGMMGGMDGMTTFYNTCLATRYPPGSCTDQCSAQTVHCREMEIQNACCGDAVSAMHLLVLCAHWYSRSREAMPLGKLPGKFSGSAGVPGGMRALLSVSAHRLRGHAQRRRANRGRHGGVPAIFG